MLGRRRDAAPRRNRAAHASEEQQLQGILALIDGLIDRSARTGDFGRLIDAVDRSLGSLDTQRAVAAKLGRVVAVLPPEHDRFDEYADLEATALERTGRSGEAVARRIQVMGHAMRGLETGTPGAAEHLRLASAAQRLGTLLIEADIGTGQLLPALEVPLSLAHVFEEADAELAGRFQDILRRGQDGLTQVLIRHGRTADAEAAYVAGLDEHGPDDYRRGGALNHERNGDLQLAYGRPQRALEAYIAALDLQQARVSVDPDDMPAQRAVSILCGKAGDLALAGGDQRKAALLCEHGVRAAMLTTAHDRTDLRAEADLAAATRRRGDLRLAGNDPKGARTIYLEVLAGARERYETDPCSVRLAHDLYLVTTKAGDVALLLGARRDAARRYAAALDVAEHLARTQPLDVRWQQDLAVARQRVA
jgi:tetratricopeptide (TPR) repeat protein